MCYFKHLLTGRQQNGGLPLRAEDFILKKPIHHTNISVHDRISIVRKVSRFGPLFILIQVGGTLLTRFTGSYGLLATGLFGGLASSASATAAAATMPIHGKLTASLAGSVTIVSSRASAVINLPIVWKTIKDKKVVRKLTVEIMAAIIIGIVVLDRAFLIYDIEEIANNKSGVLKLF